METTLRAPSLCPGDVKVHEHIERRHTMFFFFECVCKVESIFTFFAIQRTLSS